MAHQGFRFDSERNPIAELARPIGQSARLAGNPSAETSFRENFTSDGNDELPQLPPAPQLPDADAYEREGRFGEVPDNDEIDDDEGDERKATRGRVRGVALALALSGLALLGGAGIFAYRNIFASSEVQTTALSTSIRNQPNTILPIFREPKNRTAAATALPIENGVLPAEGSGKTNPAKPRATSSTIETPKSSTFGVDANKSGSSPGFAQTGANQTISRVAVAPETSPQPIPASPTQRPDQSEGVDTTGSINPKPTGGNSNGAGMTQPTLGGKYSVQVSSDRSKTRAQSAFQSLQAKYPEQLRGRRALIRRADLGTAGIYYRALVGPFRSAKEAGMFCSALKTAGGDCVIQKN